MITQSAEGFTVEDLFAALDRYDSFAGQLEEGGETGYLHFQVYLQHSNPIRFSTLKKRLPTAHLEPRRGSKQQALDYVTKEDSRVGEPFFHGKIVTENKRGKRSDLEDFHRAIVHEDKSAGDVLLSDPRALRYGSHLERLQMERDNRRFRSESRDVTAHYLYGPTGSGKTSGILGLHDPADCYRVSNYKNPFDAYRGESVLILDEFDGSMDFGTLLNVLDRHPLRLPARYSDKWAAFTEAWVVSNLPLTEFYQEIQRLEKPRWKALLRRFASVSVMPFRGYVLPHGGQPKDMIPLSQMRDNAVAEVTRRSELYRQVQAIENDLDTEEPTHVLPTPDAASLAPPKDRSEPEATSPGDVNALFGINPD